MDECEQNNGLQEEELIDEAKHTLENTIGWINNCDSKTGILLALLGVILTLVLTNEGLNSFTSIIAVAVSKLSFWCVMYLLLTFAACICLLYGMYKLISVLFATIDSNKFKEKGLETDSKVFFGTVSRSKSFQSYREKFVKMDRASYANDLLSQVYINSAIAQKKYQNFNVGLKHSMFGFAGLIVLLIAGIFLYL